MDIQLEERVCPECDRTFKVMKSSKQIYDCKYCEEISGSTNSKEKFLCLTKTQKKRTDTEKNIEKSLKKSSILKEGLGIGKIETWKESGPKTLTTPIKKEKGKENTEGKTEKKFSPIKETIMQKTEIESKSKSIKVNEKENLQSDYTQPLTAIAVERSDSVRLLNDMAEHLMKLGTYLAKPKKDDFGEIICNSSDSRIIESAKIMSELRNVMNTKLNYLKLGKELLNERRKE